MRSMIEKPERQIKYESREEFILALKRYGWNDEEISRILCHEDGHFRKAVELGYSPKYCIGTTEVMWGTIGTPGVTLDRQPSDDHLREIILAVKNPSSLDLEMLSRLNI